MRPGRSSPYLWGQASVLCAAFVSLTTYATSQPAQSSVFRGVKIDADGRPFTSPGATLSIKALTSGERRTFGGPKPTFEAPLPAGDYEVGAQVPDGYAAYYSFCRNCDQHPPESYKPYGDYNAGRVVVTIGANQSIDMAWRFVQQPQLRLPVSTAGTESSALSIADAKIATENVGQVLTCNLSGAIKPAPATDSAIFKGASDIWVRAGVNRDLGGVGVLLELINPRAPNLPLQVIDARSAGGAAWQSTIGLIQQVGSGHPIAHFNQGAGNSDKLWGFATAFAVSPDLGIMQKHWVPLWSNDVETGTGTGVNSLTTPCYHTGVRFGNGRLQIAPSYLPVTVDGKPAKVLRLTWRYEFKSVGTHPFASSFVPSADEQALYLLRSATNARSGDLRIYFSSADESAVLGPIKAHDAFASSLFDRSAVQRVNCPPDPTKPCFVKTKLLKWAVLVWKVAGQDVGMAISGENVFQDQTETRFVGVLNLRRLLMCKDPEDDACGNVQWHTVFNLPPSGVVNSGDVITQKVRWDIGTLPQLRALGINIPE